MACAEAGAWLNVLPMPLLGTKLDDELHLVFTLVLQFFVEHTCVCGATVDTYGTHSLSCQRNGGCFSRHPSANETIHCAFLSGGVPAVLEPVVVCWDDGT